MSFFKICIFVGQHRMKWYKITMICSYNVLYIAYVCMCVCVCVYISAVNQLIAINHIQNKVVFFT